MAAQDWKKGFDYFAPDRRDDYLLNLISLTGLLCLTDGQGPAKPHALLRKHGVPDALLAQFKPGNGPDQNVPTQVLAAIQDKGACYADFDQLRIELVAAVPGNLVTHVKGKPVPPRSSKAGGIYYSEAFTKSNLAQLKINGDKAEGVVNLAGEAAESLPITFRRINQVWYIDDLGSP